MADSVEWFRPGVPLRAQRVTLSVAARYRTIGEERWHLGRTENISQSGLLIRGARLFSPGFSRGLKTSRDNHNKLSGAPETRRDHVLVGPREARCDQRGPLVLDPTLQKAHVDELAEPALGGVGGDAIPLRNLLGREFGPVLKTEANEEHRLRTQCQAPVESIKPVRKRQLEIVVARS